VALCRSLDSYQPVLLEVEIAERTVSARTTVQRALSALYGLTIATSACPHTLFFRPMARFHLPLASEEETLFRAASSDLMAQYFRLRAGAPADWELTGLVGIYRDMQLINRARVARLRYAEEKDASVNAVILLDLLATAFPEHSIHAAVAHLEPLFDGFLAER